MLGDIKDIFIHKIKSRDGNRVKKHHETDYLKKQHDDKKQQIFVSDVIDVIKIADAESGTANNCQ